MCRKTACQGHQQNVRKSTERAYGNIQLILASRAMLTSYLSLKGKLYKEMQKQSSLLRTQKFQHLVLNPLKGGKKKKKDICYKARKQWCKNPAKSRQQALPQKAAAKRLPLPHSLTVKSWTLEWALETEGGEVTGQLNTLINVPSTAEVLTLIQQTHKYHVA